METTMNLEKYKSMKKASTISEEKKSKNIDIVALFKKTSSNMSSEFRNNYKHYQYDYEEDFYEPRY